MGGWQWSHYCNHLYWPVRVNGSALAEGLRLYNRDQPSLYTGDRLYRSDFQVLVTLPWGLAPFVVTQEGGDAEPTEAQYDEISRQMRLPANMRPTSIFTESTWKRWNQFNHIHISDLKAGERFSAGRRLNFQKCIPHCQTNPLMVPELAAVQGLAEAIKCNEPWFDKSNQSLQRQNGFFDFNTGETFNLDFSTLDNTDVLENFDFDSFLNTTTDDAFNFDSGWIGGDFGVGV